MRGVEVADVDAQLERVGGHDRQQLALGQPALELAPLRGRVAGAVGGDPLGQVVAAGVLQALAGEALDQLHAAARLQEADGAHVVLHQVGQQVGRLGEGRARAARAPRSRAAGSTSRSAARRAARRRGPRA